MNRVLLEMFSMSFSRIREDKPISRKTCRITFLCLHHNVNQFIFLFITSCWATTLSWFDSIGNCRGGSTFLELQHKQGMKVTATVPRQFEQMRAGVKYAFREQCIKAAKEETVCFKKHKTDSSAADTVASWQHNSLITAKLPRWMWRIILQTRATVSLAQI